MFKIEEAACRVVHRCNLSTWEVYAEGSGNERHSEFEVSVASVKHHLKNTQTQPYKQNR